MKEIEEEEEEEAEEEEEEDEREWRRRRRQTAVSISTPHSLFCFFSLVTTTMEKAGGTRLVTAIPEDGPDPTDGAMRDTTSERTEVFREILLLASRLSFLSLSRSRSELSDLGMVDQ